jgi:serine/threonine-protein kinase
VSAQEASLVGQTIGNYKVVEQIGEGGMGVVYMAEHPIIGRKVAIKLLHASFARDQEMVARFFNEARAIHMIRHPNIVEILDFGQTADGQPYFTMEFLVGQSLAARIEQGPIPASEAVAIASQICDALQAAHDKNVIHRDLKPHNVFLAGGDGGVPPEVKILDFGVAKMTAGWGEATESGGRSVKTRTGSLMGTPLYMSPEQCRGSGKLDHRTDIYSLAVILFEMISGRPPFVAEGVGELFAKHMLEPPPSLATLAPGTPPNVVKAVARALSKDLDERFPDMRSLRHALDTPEVEPVLVADADEPPVGARPASVAFGTATAATSGRGGTASWDMPTGGTASRGETASSMPVAQSTTFSSAASELDDSLEVVPRKSRLGVLLGALAAVAVVAGGAMLARRPGAVPSAAPPTAGAGGPSASPAAPAAAATSAPAPSHVPAQIDVRIEAEPATTHVLRRTAPGAEPEDLGQVPLFLSLPRTAEGQEYLLRAEGHKERAVRIDALHDGPYRFTLDPAAAATIADRKPRPPDHKAVGARPPRRLPIHDADGLAVPSF